MKSLLLALFFAVLVAADDPTDFIIGGSDAILGQFPYMVSIRYLPLFNHGCGGGILNQRWVLTVKKVQQHWKNN